MVDVVIRLFEAMETSFATNGLGSLSDASKCVVVEERNGSYELEMEYPISGRRYSDLALRRLIVAKPNPYANPQPFRIYEISKPISGLVTIKAEHISYDMTGYPVAPFKASDVTAALANLKNNGIVSCPFEFSADISSAGELNVLKPASMRALLGGSKDSILDTYGGEYEFDGYRVILHAKRGENRGVTIRYGKNMTDLKQEENCSNVYTAVYPFWYSDEWGLIDLPEKTVAAPGEYDFTRIYPLDLSSAWENSYEWEDQYPSEDEIRALAVSYMEEQKIGIPTVSLTVSFEQLSQSKEYAILSLLEAVHLCDTVNVEFPQLNVSAVSKCIKTTYNVLTGKYDSIDLGEARSNLESAITARDDILDEKMNSRPTKSFMALAVERATQLISGGLGGYVIIHNSAGGKHPDEILIMDTEDVATAKKVWRWNKGGLGYSDKGYNGPYATAITQDGEIVADFVKTGHLTASLIQGGTLTVGGLDNANGTIEVRDAKNQLLIKLGVDGMSFSGDGKKPVTQIVEDTVTTEYLNAKNITAAEVAAENITGETISGKKITGSKISGSTITGGSVIAGGADDGTIEVRDAKNQLLIKLGVDGMSFSGDGKKPVTQIVEDTVTTEYLNAKNITAAEVAAENITGETISGKKITGSEISGSTITGTVYRSEVGNYFSKIEAGQIYSTLFNLIPPSGDGFVPGITKLNRAHDAVMNSLYFYDNETDLKRPLHITKDVGGSLTHLPNVAMLTEGRIYSAGAICPKMDGGHPCGTADYKWKVIHAKNGEINTSDLRKKRDIRRIGEKYEDLFFRLKPVTFRFRDGDRTHFGIISQDLKAAMDLLGLSDMDVAAFCRDVKMRTVMNEDTGQAEEVPDLDEDGGIQYHYGVRYGEFIMLIVHMLQRSYQKIEEQQRAIEELKRKVEQIADCLEKE